MATAPFVLVFCLSIFVIGEGKTSASASEKKKYLSRLASIYSSVGWQRSEQVNSTAIAAMLMDRINDDCGPEDEQILYEFRLQEFDPSTGYFSAVASTGGSLRGNPVRTHLFRGWAHFGRMTLVNVTSVLLPREQVRRTSARTIEQLPKQHGKATRFNNGSQGESVRRFLAC